MIRFASPVTVRLERGRLLAWPRQSGTRLRVIAGSAWVTQRDDPEDHFLRPGETLDLRPGSRALISAEQDASLAFETDRGIDLGAWRARLRALVSNRPAATTSVGLAL